MSTTTFGVAKRLAIAGVLAGLAVAAMGQATSPAGLWKTIDDSTKKEKSFVRIVETNGVFSGRVEKIVDPDSPKDAVCKECSDDRKDQPIVGMTIMRNVRQSGEDKAVFGGGEILDPNNGKVYRVKLKLMDDGIRLQVRGYIGTPLLGRTQTWIRAE
jgi:uncharacterized protein (DUF2147 family)